MFYVAFNRQGHIAMGSLQVEETSAYRTVNHPASVSNYMYQISNMKRLARDSNQQLQRLKAGTPPTTPPSPPVCVLQQDTPLAVAAAHTTTIHIYTTKQYTHQNCGVSTKVLTELNLTHISFNAEPSNQALYPLYDTQ